MIRYDEFDKTGLTFTPEQKRAVYQALGELAAAGLGVDLRDVLRLFTPPLASALKPADWERYMGRPEKDTDEHRD